MMYVMMKMMIDHFSFGISLRKISGFNDSEVRWLYLGGAFISPGGACKMLPMLLKSLYTVYSP